RAGARGGVDLPGAGGGRRGQRPGGAGAGPVRGGGPAVHLVRGPARGGLGPLPALHAAAVRAPGRGRGGGPGGAGPAGRGAAPDAGRASGGRAGRLRGGAGARGGPGGGLAGVAARAGAEPALKTDGGERVVVGVNRFTLEQEERYEPLRVDPRIEDRQRAALAALRAERDGAAV
ncbi:hypothetical protein GTW69_27495, partial [Streptomyces sp. SID7760]|nr:hypothetical protein [Streptomyces sp. SID7760]